MNSIRLSVRPNGKPRRAGFEPALSDAECLTIEIVGHFLGYSSQKKLYEQMREHFLGYFPDLKDRSSLCAPIGQFVACQSLECNRWSWPTCKDTLPLVRS